ncbi:hypothetical protein QQS21_011314 [Conoideocrella luteorostrata]|uniref:FAD-binding domain-containing protein n=1 Tax=Conoideocrella luteorostrata TaxID=1105319 RepID=A0AAJ0CDK8_9HYPO|nr:hypothetical protein QQS21_011314 [Conoideocrella luteorostrata]
MSESHFLAGKQIVIAGSGFAGLSFAIALHQNWPSSRPRPQITIYERQGRHLPLSRQGYSLSLHGFDQNGGLVAARDVGLLDDLMKHAVTKSNGNAGFRLWSSDWTQLLSLKFEPYQDIPSSGFRIARNDLREVYVAAAERLYDIQWNTVCTSAERLPDGRMRVHLSSSGEGGQSFTNDCDLLIAADGAHSNIRASFRPDDTLKYAGAIQIGGVGRFPNGIPEPVSKNWGMVIAGQGVGCFFSPVDATGVVWGLSFKEAMRTSKYDSSSGQHFAALKEEALQRGHMIQEPFRTIVHATEQESSFMIPARDKRPFAHAGDAALRGVVFLGDTNHAVSPFAGNGANMALMDGLDLARQICACQSMDDTLVAYDKLAVPRAESTLKESHSRIHNTHARGLHYYAMMSGLWVGSKIFWLMGKT